MRNAAAVARDFRIIPSLTVGVLLPMCPAGEYLYLHEGGSEGKSSEEEPGRAALRGLSMPGRAAGWRGPRLLALRCPHRTESARCRPAFGEDYPMVLCRTDGSPGWRTGVESLPPQFTFQMVQLSEITASDDGFALADCFPIGLAERFGRIVNEELQEPVGNREFLVWKQFYKLVKSFFGAHNSILAPGSLGYGEVPAMRRAAAVALALDCFIHSLTVGVLYGGRAGHGGRAENDGGRIAVLRCDARVSSPNGFDIRGANLTITSDQRQAERQGSSSDHPVGEIGHGVPRNLADGLCHRGSQAEKLEWRKVCLENLIQHKKGFFGDALFLDEIRGLNDTNGGQVNLVAGGGSRVECGTGPAGQLGIVEEVPDESVGVGDYSGHLKNCSRGKLPHISLRASAMSAAEIERPRCFQRPRAFFNFALV